MHSFFDIANSEIQGLEGKVAIITGGSSGIGFATSELFTSKGAFVVQADLNPPPKSLPRSTYIETDVTSWKSLAKLFQTTIKDHGKIDIVFANAGVGPKTDYLGLAADQDGELVEPSRLCLKINLIAVINTAALALHYMQKQETGGVVVMTISVAGYQGFNHADYTVSKHGVVGLLRGVCGGLNLNSLIRVNAVAPSWTETAIIPLPLTAFAKVGLSVQPPMAVALGVGLLATDPTRHAQTIYCVNGRYKELEEEILGFSAVTMGFESVAQTEAGRFQEVVKATIESLQQ